MDQNKTWINCGSTTVDQTWIKFLQRGSPWITKKRGSCVDQTNRGSTVDHKKRGSKIFGVDQMYHDSPNCGPQVIGHHGSTEGVPSAFLGKKDSPEKLWSPANPLFPYTYTYTYVYTYTYMKYC